MAVLPFRNRSDSATLEIGLGMAEEVSAALARFCAPRLIATATFWDGSGPVADAIARCRDYQLDYIIDGTIDVLGDRVHVDVALSDVVLDFEVLWRGRFEGNLSDLFTLQHRIAFDMVTQVDPELFHRGADTKVPVNTEVPAAHQCVLTSIQAIHRLDQAAFMQARDLLTRAIELDPNYAAAHAWLAYWSIIAAGLGFVANPRDVTTLAGDSAERAVLLDPFNARALAIAGHVRGYLFHDVPAALHLHARAIELNPNLPIAWTVSSWSRIYNGEHTAAIRHAMMAQSLSPHDPHIWFPEHAMTMAQMLNRNLEEAELLSGAVLERHANHIAAVIVRLVILGHLGRKDEAKTCLARLRGFDPNVTIDKISSRVPLQPEDRIFYIEGLERSGVPR
jgi:TolB-like protein/Tfp pilus assembly protein PilF